MKSIKRILTVVALGMLCVSATAQDNADMTVKVIRDGTVVYEGKTKPSTSATLPSAGGKTRSVASRDDPGSLFVIGTALTYAKINDVLVFIQHVQSPTDVATITVSGATPAPPYISNTITAPAGQDAQISVIADKIGTVTAHGTSTLGSNNTIYVQVSYFRLLGPRAYALGYCEDCPFPYLAWIPIGSSVDNVRLSHQHEATDYETSVSQPSCSSCSASFDGSGQLPSLAIKRFHRYIDSDWRGSFGPGVFSNFDIMLNLYAPNQAELFDPQNHFPLDFADAQSNGIYINNSHLAVRDLRLYDAGNALTGTQASATSAVLTTLTGQTYTFELFTIDGAASGNFHGRLTKIADRNGNAITLAYADPVASTDDQLNFDRSRLWRIATATDAYGLGASFTYTHASGQWVVQTIALPNGASLAYSYNDNNLVGLTGITYPTGPGSVFSTTPDPIGNMQRVTYDDAGAVGTHRRKDVYLSTISWNLNGAFQIQPGNRLRQIVNGDGEFVYYNWNATDGNTISTYFYDGAANSGGSDTSSSANAGTLKRFDTTLSGSPIAAYTAITWDPTQSVDTYTWELIESYTADNQYRMTSGADNLGRKTVYSRDPVSGAILAEARFNADSTQYASESTTYNQFRQPLTYTDRLGRITRNVYDNNGNLLTKTVALGTAEEATWTWTYNAKGQPLTLTDANTNVTTYHYDDPRGFLTSVTEPPDVPNGEQAVRQFTYDAAGRLQTSVDAVNRTTHFDYDTRSRIQTITYSDNSTELYFYGTNQGGFHDANSLVAFRDRNGVYTQMEYDDAGRKVISAVQMPDQTLQDVKVWKYRYGTSLPTDLFDRGKRTSFAYDYRNRLISTTVRPTANTVNNLVSLQHYDADDHMDFSTDPYGRRTFYIYDVEDRVVRTVRETVPGGIVDTTQVPTLLRNLNANAPYLIEDLTFDVESQLLQRTDARGIGTAFQYDHQGRLNVSVVAASKLDGTGAQIAITDPKVAARTENTYDLQGNLVSVKLPRSFDPNDSGNFITQYSYTGRNLLASTTVAFGRPETATAQFTYYLDRRSKDTVDARGNTWTKVWKECCARLGVVADPVGDGTAGIPVGNRPTTLYEYDFYGMPTHVTRVKNVNPLPTCCYPDPVDADTLNELTTKYDARHRPVAQTVWLAPLGSVDPNNPPIAGDNGVDPALGLTTRWQYDDDLTDGVGLDATYGAALADLNFGIDSPGYAVAVTNPAGETSVTVYDGLYRVVRTIDPLGHAASIAYDSIVAGTPGAPGNLVETTVTDALNHSGKARLDGAGRRLASIDAESHLSSYAYDANGNTLSSRDPNNVGIDCTYDERNRNLLCTDTHGDTSSRSYDAHSNVLTSTDALNHASSCVYDARDRKSSCTDRISGLTTYTYDANSNLLTIEDADANAGNTGKQTVYTYDSRNLLATETFPDNGVRKYTYDGASRLASRLDQKNELTSYNYDYANRLTGRVYPDNLNDGLTYDAASRMLTASSARYGNTVTRTYDHASRMTSDQLTIGAASYSVGYGYDAANRQTSVTYPDSSVVSRTFTNRNQLATVQFNNNPVISRTYDDGMRLNNTTYGNALSETRTYRDDGVLRDNMTNTIAIAGVTNFSYQWDANKRKQQENDTSIPTNQQTYGYDNEDRLTSFNRSNGQTQTWNLSFVGDWNTFNNNGTLETRTHDFVHELTVINATPLTYDPKGNLTQNSNGQTYAWDFDNHLTQAVVGADTAAYAYDALGRRVSKTFQGSTTVYVSDGVQEIAEYTNGTLQREYVFGAYADEPLMMSSGGQNYYYHTNDQYSVSALTDANGNVVERYKYDPYGVTTVLAPDGLTVRTTSAVGNPYQWQGGRVDLETGLNYKRARYYSPALGRFVSRDPIGYLGGTNLYGFCGEDPVNKIDPTGLEDYPPPPTPKVKVIADDPKPEPLQAIGPGAAWAVYKIAQRTLTDVELSSQSAATTEAGIQAEMALIKSRAAANMVRRAMSSPAAKATALLGAFMQGITPKDDFGRPNVQAMTDVTDDVMETFLGTSLRQKYQYRPGEYYMNSGTRPAPWADQFFGLQDPEASIVYSPMPKTSLDYSMADEATLKQWAAENDVYAIDELEFNRKKGVGPRIARCPTKPGIEDYKKVFFAAHPDLEGLVWVHHAIEQQVLDKFPGLFTEAEIHSLSNLRGIPNDVNSELHLSMIRQIWNQFYKQNPDPSRGDIINWAKMIDKGLGQNFWPPVGK